MAKWGKRNRIIIYGIHSKDWMDALNPDGLVWSKVLNCEQVLAIPDQPEKLPKRSYKFRDVIIPLMENHIRNVPIRSLGIRPNGKALAILENKKSFADFLQDTSMQAYAPRHYHIEDSFEFPIILKRVDLNGGNGILKLDSYSEIQTILATDFWVNQEYVLQEHIAGANEFTFHAVFKDGKRVWGTCFKYKSDSEGIFPLVKNVLETKKVTIDSVFLETFDEILSLLNYSGPCNIDFKLQGSNLKILEINPRLGGSLMRSENVDLLADCLTAMIKVA